MNVESTSENAVYESLKRIKVSGPPVVSPRPAKLAKRAKLTGGDFRRLALWLTLERAAEFIGVPKSELKPFVQGWLRDPISGEKARIVRGIEVFARENVEKLRVYVQPKPQVFFTVKEAAQALGVSVRDLRARMFLGVIDWSYGDHGRMQVYLPLDNHYHVAPPPMSARKMESPCPSLCRPAQRSVYEEIWAEHAASGRPWGPRIERKTARRAAGGAR